MREEPGYPLAETLAKPRRSKRLLRVLDSCERLLGACAGLAQHLLGAVPEVRVLAGDTTPPLIAIHVPCRDHSDALPAPREHDEQLAPLISAPQRVETLLLGRVLVTGVVDEGA